MIDFTQVSIETPVFDPKFGWGRIISIDEKGDFPVGVLFDYNNFRLYPSSGKINDEQRLFLKKSNVQVPRATWEDVVTGLKMMRDVVVTPSVTIIHYDTHIDRIEHCLNAAKAFICELDKSTFGEPRNDTKTSCNKR